MEQATLPLELVAPSLHRMTRDMRFVAWTYVIYGGLMCLTIIGAIFGVPYLISGLRLKEAAEDLDAYARAGRYELMLRAFEKQRSFFFIQKVLIIVGLVFMVLYFIFLITMLPALLESLGNGGVSV